MMNNNIYGLVGIENKGLVWDANTNGEARRDGMGNIYATQFALQFCMKQQWRNNGEKILEGKFNEGDKVYKDVIKQLLAFKNVQLFGKVSKTNKFNIGIRGMLQFGLGYNKYEKTEEIVGNGEVSRLDEAHFVYDFSLFPSEYNQYKEFGYEGFKEENYQEFKDNITKCVSNYNSKVKVGCKNEFALFVKMKEEANYKIALGNLGEYVKIEKEDKVIYDLTDLSEVLEDVKDAISEIEVYYNKRKVEIKGLKVECKRFNIINGKIID